MNYKAELEEAKRHIDAAEDQIIDLHQLGKLNHRLIKISIQRAERNAAILERLCKKLGVDIDSLGPEPGLEESDYKTD